MTSNPSFSTYVGIIVTSNPSYSTDVGIIVPSNPSFSTDVGTIVTLHNEKKKKDNVLLDIKQIGKTHFFLFDSKLFFVKNVTVPSPNFNL